MNGLDLFSGIGGLTLALEPYVVPVAYCENEPYAQAVLLSRMYEGKVPTAPIWDDVRTLRGADFLGGVDIIYGGFPCQDISQAGRGVGLEGERSRLYWEIHRLTKEIKPSFLFLENVPAIRTRGLDVVVRSLTDIGYDCRWTVVSASEVGAPHLRKRWFLLAHTDGDDLRKQSGRRVRASGENSNGADRDGEAKSVAYTYSTGLELDCEVYPRGERKPRRNAAAGSGWWDVEPDVGRVADGVSKRVDRLTGLGNAVVPFQAQVAFERLMGL